MKRLWLCAALWGAACSSDPMTPSPDGGGDASPSDATMMLDVAAKDTGAVSDATDATNDTAGGDAATEASSDAGCSGNLTLCNGSCVDLQTSATNCGKCGHDCLGAACTAGACDPITLASNQDHPYGIAVNATNAYFANITNISWCAIGGCGNNPTVLVSSLPYRAFSVTLDATNVYFTVDQNGTVRTCAIAGCGNTPTTIASSQAQPWGLVNDGTNLFWTNNYGGTTAKCAVGGCSNSPQTLASLGGMGSASPAGMTLDATYVYWANLAAASVVRCAKAGCNNTPTTYATNQNVAREVAVDATNVYWITNDSIRACALGGCNGNPTILASGQSPKAIATDGIDVYWLDASTIRTCAVGGCNNTPKTLATLGSSMFGQMTLDAKAVYATQTDIGKVWKVAK